MDEQEYEVSIDIQEEIAEEEDQSNNDGYIKMDFSLETPEERNELVKKIIAETPSERLTPRYLEKLADYIIFAMDKQERKEKKILTDNRMVTVNKRETSFEGLVGRLENGEDGIYSMIANDKNIIFSPKVSITQKDIDEIPGLKELRESIESLEKQFKKSRGKKAYLIKKQIITLCQDQYILKNSYRKPIYNNNAQSLIKTMKTVDLREHIWLDENGIPQSDGLINFFNEQHVSLLLCNYSKLKEDSWTDFNGDTKWMMMDLDNLIENALKDKYPLYYDLLIYKIDGKQNTEIQDLLEKDHGVRHSVEYISSLWRKKIPKLIVEQARKEWLLWHFTFQEKGYWKKCSRCGQIKLGHNYFFSKNKTAKDGWYSICKECRNKKSKE